MSQPVDRSVRVVAVVPARGGSRGVPGKNLARVGGRRLVERAVQAAAAADGVDLVVVSTDDDEIATAARAAGARVVTRPAELSGGTATSESAVLHSLDVLCAAGVRPEVTVLVQCTSPFIDPADLSTAVKAVRSGELDSCFAAVRTHAFLWRLEEGLAHGLNHDHRVRVRRQDAAPDWRETGAFYVMRTDGLRSSGHRFFGRVGVQEVDATAAVDVDEPADLEVARALAHLVDRSPGAVVDVDAVVTDFDGVHTDDTATVDQQGHETVRVSRADGLGVAMLRAAGVRVLVLSSETNEVVGARARKLGVPVLQGIGDKAAALGAWLDDEGLDPSRVAYLGNDLNDLGALALVGWPVTVPGAPPRVRAAARLVLDRSGGQGAVRDLCDRVLTSKGL